MAQRARGYVPSIVVQLRPTTPFRPRGFLDRAIGLLQRDPAAHSVRAVTAPHENPFKMWTHGADGYLHPLVASSFRDLTICLGKPCRRRFGKPVMSDVVRTSTVTELHSLTGSVVIPTLVDRDYVVDIDRLADFDHAEKTLLERRLDIDFPAGVGRRKRQLPDSVELLVLDFDGTLTDDRVWVDQDGGEMVSAHRGDGMGLAMLKKADIPALVFSTEKNPVVARRCEKLSIPYYQWLNSKIELFNKVVQERGLSMKNTIFMGNDINDLGCIRAGRVFYRRCGCASANQSRS